MALPGRILGGLFLVLMILLPMAVGQDRDRELPAPRSVSSREGEGPEIRPITASAPLATAVPVSLVDVLKVATIANLDIAQANLVIERARASYLQAASSFLPNLNVGATYTGHEGTIQRTEGTVVEVNRDSLFVGGGALMTVNFSDALYALPEARQRLEATLSGQVRITNDTLLQVANAYFNVLRARRQLARLDETLDFLTSEKESDLRGGSKGLLPLIKAFVQAGNALPSDQARVEADVVRRLAERARAAQDVRVASAELARLLHMNATIFLLPCEDFRWPLELPGKPWYSQPIDTLVYEGLRNRPELAENQALVQAAFLRYQRSKYRPLVPNLVVNYSYGGFGGGPEAVGRTATGSTILGQSGVIADFDSRSDLEVGLVWRLQGMGVGNAAQIWDNRVRLESRQVQQLYLHDLVVSQVVQAAEQIQRGAERVDICRAGLFDEKNKPDGAIYRSLRLNFLRIKGGQGLPLEVLDSTRRLSDVLDQYANALTDYDQARFRLLIALGMRPQAIIEPRMMPLPPINTIGPRPPVSPLASTNVAPAAEAVAGSSFRDPRPELPLVAPVSATMVENPINRAGSLTSPPPGRTGSPQDGLQPLPPIRQPNP
ncbi:MAG: TolC family protein [Gemmataceae bacterium]